MTHTAAPSRSQSVALHGVLDLYGLRDARTALRALDAGTVTIDLSQVRLISAAFIGELARLRRRLPSSEIRIVGANADVRRVLDLVRYSSLLAADA
jgi:anti-anti-sigma regulatory factor